MGLSFKLPAIRFSYQCRSKENSLSYGSTALLPKAQTIGRNRSGILSFFLIIVNTQIPVKKLGGCLRACLETVSFWYLTNF